jgi:hypothetical protein
MGVQITTPPSSGGGSGTVSGPGPSPGSSTDNAVVRWDGTTGTTVQNSRVTVADTGAVTITPSGVSSYTPLITIANNNTTTPMIVWTSDSAGNNRGLQFAPDGGIAAGILNDGSIFGNTFSPAGPGEQKLAINFLTLQTRGSAASTPSSGYQTLYFKTDKSLYMVDNTGLESKINTESGYVKYTINYTDISVAADNTTVTLFSLPAKSFPQVLVHATTKFAGSGGVSLTVLIDTNGFVSASGLETDPVADFSIGTSNIPDAASNMSFTLPKDLNVQFSADTNLNNLTTGSVDIYVKVTTLP